MGQKTDKIKELQNELAAERYLLRKIGDTVGCEFEPPTTTAEATKEHQRFLDALRNMSGGGLGVVDWDKAKPASRPRRLRPAAPGSWDTHDEEVDEQIDRLEAQGLTKPRQSSNTLEQFEASVLSPPRGALVTTDFTQADIDGILRSTIRDIAHELGLNEAMDPAEALGAIHEEIVRVKNQGADVEAESGSKFLSANKSLGQAIAHDHAQAADLRDAATAARTIVARLAAVMQIGQWDKDGTELLERAQKWEMWKFDLMKRIKELRARPTVGVVVGTSSEVHATDMKVADELQRQLDRLLSPKELGNWLKSLEKAAAAGAVKMDAGPPVPPYPFKSSPSDATHILSAVRSRFADDCDLAILFKDIVGSRVASEEFARTMNLVILPILARQRAAQKVPEDASRPAAE